MLVSRLGDSDLEVSRVGLGCNNFGGRVDLEGTRAVVDAALEAGVTFLDTADTYGRRGPLRGRTGLSEEYLGRALEGRRDRVVLATKFGDDMDGLYGGDDLPRGSPAYVRRAIEGSLRRLRTDRIDLYYYHRPDGITPIAETLGALDELVRQGLVRAIGCSNVSSEQLREADVARAGAARFVALQNEYSLLARGAETTTLPVARELGIGFVPFFPLANGLLTGKVRRGEEPPAGSRLAERGERPDDETLARIEGLEAFATELGHTLLELAIAGLASREGVASVIAGATKPEQVRANARAADWSLSEEELRALDRVAR